MTTNILGNVLEDRGAPRAGPAGSCEPPSAVATEARGSPTFGGLLATALGLGGVVGPFAGAATIGRGAASMEGSVSMETDVTAFGVARGAAASTATDGGGGDDATGTGPVGIGGAKWP